MGRPFRCKFCGSTDTASKGARKTKTMGTRRLRRCRACKRKFTPKHQPDASVDLGPMVESTSKEPEIRAEAARPDISMSPQETLAVQTRPGEDELIK